MIRSLALAGVAATLALATPAAWAQERPGRGNFDPEEMRQRMMDDLRERLEVKGDAEWKIIEARITKVNEARRQVGGGFAAFARGGGFARGGRGGDDQGQGGRGGGGGGANRARFGGDTSPETEALQKAIESNASADEIKAKLAKYREARKAKQAELTKAQEELRAVLSVKQEAIAVTRGLLE